MEKEQEALLTKALPDWAVKPNPMNSKMSVINPMAVIDRFNEVFGVGGWEFMTEYIDIQPAKMGAKDAFAGTCKSIFIVRSENIHLEQFGGSTNMDRGDALKGSATDSLTKIASYLGIGASVYKNMGNVDIAPPVTTEEAFTKLRVTTTLENLATVYKSLPVDIQKDGEVVALKDELKAKYV